MVATSPLLTFAVVAVATLGVFGPSTVDAHGRLMKPLAEYRGREPDSPVAALEGPQVLPPPAGKSYTGTPESNTEAFTTAFKASKYTTLRQFLNETLSAPKVVGQVFAENLDTKCGISRIGSPQPLPDQVEFGFRPGEGFVSDHQGPCEIWCDDVRVMSDANCAKTFAVEFGKGPAKVPYDKAKCAGAKVMQFYWLAVHVPKFQVYIYCAAINGGSAGPANNNNNSPTPARTPAPANGPAPTTAPANGPAPGPAPTKKTNCARRSKTRRE
ncbi:hypothetical protein P43SY_011837 [Pythium insidiosum]|uniref:Uncharacterized protein n=1 Tax=Pythium insidiosum TaxID=114742 RepID=A0AAD5L7E2_PYTIN|nr:hypothetical protein P43SY_011837 [Pythium insidiosum]